MDRYRAPDVRIGGVGADACSVGVVSGVGGATAIAPGNGNWE